MTLVPFSKADEATFLDVSTVLWTVLVTVSKIIIQKTRNMKINNGHKTMNKKDNGNKLEYL